MFTIPLVGCDRCDRFVLMVARDEIAITDIGQDVPVHDKECIVEMLNQPERTDGAERSILVGIA